MKTEIRNINVHNTKILDQISKILIETGLAKRREEENVYKERKCKKVLLAITMCRQS
jgi:hypothetical protein